MGSREDDRRLLARGFLESFEVDGKVRVLNEPEGPATGRQLRRLNELGVLAVVEPGQVEPLTKGAAAYAIDDVEENL